MVKSLFNWKVWLNILLSIVFLLVGIWLVFRWLAYHTNHGEEIEIPHVINLPIDKAEILLQKMGISYEVDSLGFDPKFEPLQVLKVDPPQGSRIKGEREIRLYINPKTWAKVEIPNVIENYKYLAFDKLSLVGLKVRDTIYEPSNLKDAVIRLMYNGKTVDPGKLIPRLSQIDVVVGLGPIKNIPVPNLVCKTLGEAQKIISDSYFETGISYNEYDISVSDSSLIVFYQNPAAESISEQGIRIDLWSSKKKPIEMYEKIKKLDKIYHIDIKSKQEMENSIDNITEPRRKVIIE